MATPDGGADPMLWVSSSERLYNVSVSSCHNCALFPQDNKSWKHKGSGRRTKIDVAMVPEYERCIEGHCGGKVGGRNCKKKVS